MDTNHKDLRSIVNEVTSGLKDDAELRCDVEQELAAHLQEAREAFLEEGKSKEESLELALKAFGSPVEIAEELTRSNRSRMKLRASMRFLLGRVLVPFSLVIAVYIFAQHAGRLKSVPYINNLVKIQDVGFDDDTPDGIPGMSEEQAFLFYGDTTRETRAGQQRAIWEKTPDSKVYYGNYIQHLLNEFKNGKSADRLALLEREIRLSEQLDPDNAYYNYVLAAALFNTGATLNSLKTKGKEEQFELKIEDPELLQRSIQELRKARAKPNYRRYSFDMAKEQLDSLPPVKRAEDNIMRIGHLAAIILPDIHLFMNYFKALPYYAETRASEGHVDEAGFLLDAWYDFTKRANENSNTLLDFLAIASLIKKAGELNAGVYESMNKPKDTMRIRRLSKELSKPHDSWQEARESFKESKLDEIIRAKGSVLAAILMPAIGVPVEQETLRPGRMLDYNLAEQVVFMTIMVNLLIFMLCATFLYGSVRWRNRDGGTPMLLLPPARTFLMILALGILLPILLYFVYSRWSRTGSHEFSIAYNWPLVFLELILLVTTILAATTIPAARYIARRCRVLDVPAPKSGSRYLQTAFWIALAAAWILSAVMNIFHPRFIIEVLPVAVGLILAGGFMLVCIYQLIRGLASSSSFGLFYGTLARSLIPVYACAVIFVGGACLPYLAREETRLIHQDTILSPSSDYGFTSIETKLVKRLQSELSQAFDQVER